MTPLLRVATFGRPLVPRMMLAVACGVGAAAAAIGLMATSAWLLSRAAQQPPVLYLMVAVTSVRAFGILRGTLRYLERLASHDAAFRVLAELRLAAYQRLERLAPSGLEAYRSGDLLARLVGDVDGLADLWLRVLLPYAIAGIAGAGAALLVALLVPAAGGVLVLTLVAVAIGGPLVLARFTNRAERRLAPARGDLAAAAADLLNGGPELFAAGTAQLQLDDLAAIDARLVAAERRAAAGGGAATLVATLGSGTATWLALLFGIAALRAGALDGVALAVVVLTPIAAHELVAGLIPAAEHVPGLGASARRVVEVLDRPDPVRDPERPVALGAGPWGIRARGLTARYEAGGSGTGGSGTGGPSPGGSGAGGDGPRDDPPVALGPVDLALAPGEGALVTGPSGSGKSTLAAVLVRFLAPASGEVALIDDAGTAVQYETLAGDDVRRIVGLAPQDPHVFDTSIAENLRLARPDASTDDLRSALRFVHLLDWADAQPDGLDTLVGEHGARLSGGQRHRLALARVLLSRHPIVILDEPTEHLDESTAREMMADVLAAMAGRTVLVLTHRPELMPASGWAQRVVLEATRRRQAE